MAEFSSSSLLWSLHLALRNKSIRSRIGKKYISQYLMNRRSRQSSNLSKRLVLVGPEAVMLIKISRDIEYRSVVMIPVETYKEYV